MLGGKGQGSLMLDCSAQKAHGFHDYSPYASFVATDPVMSHKSA